MMIPWHLRASGSAIPDNSGLAIRPPNRSPLLPLGFRFGGEATGRLDPFRVTVVKPSWLFKTLYRIAGRLPPPYREPASRWITSLRENGWP